MTPYGATVARELRAARVAVETASIVSHRALPATIRALVKNALFWVVPTAAIEAARGRVLATSDALVETITAVGIRTQGISLEVDGARSDALLAFEALIDAVADAEPTQAARSLGIV